MPILWVCFDNHAEDGQVWAVREGNIWHRAAQIDIQIPLSSVYKGANAPQPRAYFRGSGKVVREDNTLVLTSP